MTTWRVSFAGDIFPAADRQSAMLTAASFPVGKCYAHIERDCGLGYYPTDVLTPCGWVKILNG